MLAILLIEVKILEKWTKAPSDKKKEWRKREKIPRKHCWLTVKKRPKLMDWIIVMANLGYALICPCFDAVV